MKTKNCKVCSIPIGQNSKSLLCEVCYSKNYSKTHEQEARNYRCGHREFMRKRDRDKYHKNIDISRKIGREKAKKHRREHPELVRKALQKCYYKDLSASRKRVREYSREQRVEHPEIIRMCACKWAYKHYYEDIEQSRIKARLWRHNNRLKANKQQRTRYHKDLPKSRRETRAEHFKRRLLTLELIQQVYECNLKQYGTLTCYLCKFPIAFKGKNLKFIALGRDNLEHKVSIVRGGTHTLDNMDVAHALCNSRKGSKTYQECIEQNIKFPPEQLKEVA